MVNRITVWACKAHRSAAASSLAAVMRWAKARCPSLGSGVGRRSDATGAPPKAASARSCRAARERVSTQRTDQRRPGCNDLMREATTTRSRNLHLWCVASHASYRPRPDALQDIAPLLLLGGVQQTASSLRQPMLPIPNLLLMRQRDAPAAPSHPPAPELGRLPPRHLPVADRPAPYAL